MVFKNNLVAAVKVNGKVLREQGNLVTLPFGSEYSILLKNLNSVRVLVDVSIDGKSATDGTQLIIGPRQSLDLERYIRNGNFNSGNRFKFIERTSEIEDHRGIDAEDGLIRIEYKTEKIYPPVTYTYSYPTYGTITINGGLNSGITTTTAGLGNSVQATGLYTSLTRSYAQSAQTNTVNYSAGDSQAFFSATGSMQAAAESSTPNDQGITVPGSESNQKFQYGSWFPTESQTDVIVLNLRGSIEGQHVQAPVTVYYKPTCQTCGRTNRISAKFCNNCGTALNIL